MTSVYHELRLNRQLVLHHSLHAHFDLMIWRLCFLVYFVFLNHLTLALFVVSLDVFSDTGLTVLKGHSQLVFLAHAVDGHVTVACRLFIRQGAGKFASSHNKLRGAIDELMPVPVVDVISDGRKL